MVWLLARAVTSLMYSGDVFALFILTNGRPEVSCVAETLPLGPCLIQRNAPALQFLQHFRNSCDCFLFPPVAISYQLAAWRLSSIRGLYLSPGLIDKVI